MINMDNLQNSQNQDEMKNESGNTFQGENKKASGQKSGCGCGCHSAPADTEVVDIEEETVSY